MVVAQHPKITVRPLTPPAARVITETDPVSVQGKVRHQITTENGFLVDLGSAASGDDYTFQ